MADGGPFGEWYGVRITLTHGFTNASPMPEKPPLPRFTNPYETAQKFPNL
jgi:hypothetical protein